MSVVEKSGQFYSGFDPRTILNCNLWLDGTDLSTYTPSYPSNGTVITAWNDKSGSGYNFTAAGTGGTYSSVTNGLAMTTANGYNSSHPASVSEETLFMVFTSTFNGSAYVVGATGPGGREAGTYINWTRFGNINAGLEWAAITANNSFTGGTRALGISTVSARRNMAVSINCGAFVNYTLTVNNGLSGSVTSTLGIEGVTKTYSGTIHEVIAYTRVLSTAERQQVEGYLAWKWGLVSSIGVASITSISGLQLWLDASDSSTITTSGSNVTQWNDKSGNNYHATQTTVGNRPTYSLANRNINFVNTSSQFFNLPNNALPSGNSSYSYFIVLSIANLVDGLGIIGGGSYGTNGGVFAIRSIGTNGRIHQYWWNNDLQALSTVYSANVPFLLQARYAAGGTRATLANGTQVAGDTPSSARIQGTGNNTVGVTNFAEYLNGNISEIVVFNRDLTTTERQQVEGYLSWKWNLSSQLPIAHPYRAGFILPVSHPYYLNPPFMRIFQPLDIDNCCLWLDAGDLTTFTPSNPSSETTITAWRDKSINNLSCVPVTNGAGSGLPITYRTSTGFPSVFINNSNTTLNSNSSLIQIPSQIQNGFSDFTCVAVIRFQPTSSPSSSLGAFVLQTIYANGKSGTDNRLQIGVGSSFEANTSGGAFIGFQYDNRSLLENTISIVTSVSSSTGFFQYLDGFIWQAVTSTSGTRFTADAGTNPRLGATYVDNRAATGDFYEVICYNKVLSNEERMRVEGYLSNKWNVTRARTTFIPSTLQPLLPNDSSISANLGIWNDATSYTSAQTLSTWLNRTGGTASSCSGAVILNTLNGLPVVRFSTSATYATPTVNYSSYTMFFVGRYNGLGSTGRILQGPSGQNILYGYWNSNKCVLWVNGNPSLLDSSGRARSPDNQWDIMSHTRVNGGAYTMRFNQINIYTGSTSQAANFTQACINTGGTNEPSNCDVAEIIIYNTVLTSTQIERIENYLNEKWNVYPINRFSLYKAPSVIQAFIPTSLSNLVLWLDAADLTTMFQNTAGTTPVTTFGQTVNNWRDKSGAGLNAVATGTGATYQLNAGYPSLTFNGNPMNTSTIPSTFLSSTGLTFFAVSTRTGANVTQGVLGTLVPEKVIRYDPGNCIYTVNNGTLRGGNNNTNGIRCFIDTASSFNGFVNGTNVLTSSTAVTYQAQTTSTFYQLGNLGSGANLFQGYINEIVVFNTAITTGQRQQVEGYLAWKWGLQNNLPTTHPYYKVTP